MLTPEDCNYLQRRCRVTKAGGHDHILYKEALQLIQPNYDLDDPFKAIWTVRKGQNTHGFDDNKSRYSMNALSVRSGPTSVTYNSNFHASKPRDELNGSKPRFEARIEPPALKVKIAKPTRSPAPEPVVNNTPVFQPEIELASPDQPRKKKEVKSKNNDPRLLKVQTRNVDGKNDLLSLGGGLIESQRGKAQIPNVRAK